MSIHNLSANMVNEGRPWKNEENLAEASQKSSPDERQLVQNIQQDIYLGRLAPGMWLKQVDLERRYNCTRLSLRHALEQLSSLKLVEKVPNRGFYVPNFDMETVKAVADARARVEIAIAPELAMNTPDSALEHLTQLARAFAETIRTGTLEDQDKANLAFHAEILRYGPNEIIEEIIWSLRRRIPLAIQRTTNTPIRLEKSAQQHFDMVDAIRNRDAMGLGELLSAHIRID